MSYISSSGNTVQLTLAICGYPIIQYSTLLYFFLNNYPKYLILSKNWDGFSKFRHFKNEIKSEEKTVFLESAPTRNFFSNKFSWIIKQKASFYPKIGMDF